MNMCESGGLNFLDFCTLNNVLNKLDETFHSKFELSLEFYILFRFFKSNFFKRCFLAGITQIDKLLNQEDVLLTYSEFLDVHKIPVTPRQFSVVMNAILVGVLALFRANTQNSIAPPPLLPI